MKNNILLISTFLSLVNLNQVSAQKAKISEKQIQMLTYPFSDPNPVPEFSKYYPYYSFDGYSDKGIMHTWKMVEMENDYIKLWITPEIGGKIWGAVEKATGKEFIYYNHVAKFRDVAMRGPWTSGGIEINFGVIGHAPTCSTPVDYVVRENEDGSVSCFVGAIDLSSRTRWSVEINLPPDKAYFTTRSVWDNPTLLEQSYYHWMNLGVKTAGKLEYIFPGNSYLGHGGDHSPWPLDEKGRKISFYENNNFGSYKSYHVFGEITDFYGTYWHDDDFGFGHYSPYDEKPGKKIWIWGLSDQGMIWEKLLTDSDGQYTEIQSGRLFNQAAESSSYTPFKHRGFAPGTTDEWTEFWFPVKNTAGLKYGVPAGSVNMQPGEGKVNLWFCPNEKIHGKLIVKKDNEIIYSKDVNTLPMQVITESFDYSGPAEKLSVWLDDEPVYDADRGKYVLSRPAFSPESFNWETVYAHYLRGKENERQRNYSKAGEEYGKSLADDPFFVPALNGMAVISYRKLDFEASREYALKALSVDTYDAEANMIYGLASLALNDTTSAMDGFSIASAGISLRSAAYNALASLFMSLDDYRRSLDYTEKSFDNNRLGSDAAQLKILALRKLGKNKTADDELAILEKKDPLNHFIRFERFLRAPSTANKNQAQDHITNELPGETYLDYATWYYRNGQYADALKILELAPQDHPVVLLWEGYLNHLAGNEQGASRLAGIAVQASPLLVFPYRPESLKPIEWAKNLSDSWKLNYYSGLIYMNAGAKEKAMALWNECGNRPDFFPFYIARSKSAGQTSTQAMADLERALSLAGNDWRTGLYASRFYSEKGNTKKSEEVVRDLYDTNAGNYYLALHFAKVLAMNGKYTEVIKLLRDVVVLPNEGATEGRIIWRNANIGHALDLMKQKKNREALKSIDMARQWPVNLGVGRPYEVDERFEDFMALTCYSNLKDKMSAGKITDKFIDKSVQMRLVGNQNDFLTAWILKESGNQAEGDRIINNLLAENPPSPILQWCHAVYTGEKDKAESIAAGIDKSDQTFLFLNRMFSEFINH